MGFIISIINNKGGCGKTVTSINLADALGKKNKRVLAIDMDAQCNATAKLLPQSTQIRKSLYDLLDPSEKDLNIKDIIYPTEYKNISVIPNISITGNLEPDLIKNAPDSFLRLRSILRDYSLNNFDYTIIDNPPNMGSFVLCSLYASDFVIVPVKAGSIDSVEGLIKATKLINDIQDKGNEDLKFLRILINCVDKRTAISKAIVDQIKDTFDKDQLFQAQVPVNTSFERAESSKQTIFKTDGTSQGARAFRLLAKELIDILEAT